MSKPQLLLIGAGGHALSCIDVIEQDSRFSIIGLIGLPAEQGSQRLGYNVIGTDTDLAALLATAAHALVTIGQIKSPALRIAMFERLQQLGFALPTIVSPHAYVSPHARLGVGTVVMHGAVVNAGAVVGDNCIINTRALVEHGASIGSHCHVATGALVNGDAAVGAGSFIGSGTVVREGIRIGKQCLIGMGQLVRADCADGSRVPAGKVAK